MTREKKKKTAKAGVDVGEKGTLSFYPLLVTVQMGAGTMESSVQALKKNLEIPHDPTRRLSGL